MCKSQTTSFSVPFPSCLNASPTEIPPLCLSYHHTTALWYSLVVVVVVVFFGERRVCVWWCAIILSKLTASPFTFIVRSRKRNIIYNSWHDWGPQSLNGTVCEWRSEWIRAEMEGYTGRKIWQWVLVWYTLEMNGVPLSPDPEGHFNRTPAIQCNFFLLLYFSSYKLHTWTNKV